MSTTHVILGGNGVIGRETAQALLATGVSVGSVGRQVSTVPGVTSVIADLLDRDAVRTALDGAEVAYLTAGLPYSAALWEQRWPRIVENVIEAAVATGTHLVSLDNVYAYGAVDGAMTEETPLAPVSRKGRVRARAAAALEAAVAERGLVSTVGRSADFFGPGASTSVFNLAVRRRPAALAQLHARCRSWTGHPRHGHRRTRTPLAPPHRPGADRTRLPPSRRRA
jgi:nucleoside-diphosphate-sugar epimerase